MVKSKNVKQPIYSYSQWEIVENEFSMENNYRNETIFSTGNGYLGMRGNFEEGYSGLPGTGLNGTYINGFYETEYIKYGEIAYGYPEKGQTMLNITDSKIIRLSIEDEEFNMLKGKLLAYKRSLDLKEGIIRRELLWRSPQGREILINIERIVSLSNKYLAAIRYEVTPVNFSGDIKLTSMLDGNVSNQTAENDPRVGSGLKGRVLSIDNSISEGNFGMLRQSTRNTGLILACAMKNNLETESSYSLKNEKDEFAVACSYKIDGKVGSKIVLSKYIAYVTSMDYPQELLEVTAVNTADTAEAGGFSIIKQEQAEYLQDFWYRTDVEIKGDTALQQGIRYNMFQLLQSAGKDGKTNIAAKGLSGEGYEGHYFWDTEMFMLPFFLFSSPKISRKFLEFRYGTLDKARDRARQMSHSKGALFPWRTINGEECSAYYPGGTAQYHINADIAFAVKRYMDACDDRDFLINCGAELLFETARLWVLLGDFIVKKGNKFCINDVTGPDEYTAIVNNNCYTNFMAKENLAYAYETAIWMEKNENTVFKRLEAKIKLEDEELELWKKASDNMYIPYDDELKIFPQDDSFLYKSPWDFENTPEENYPLLLHYHPLVIYRHQVCKQADLVLAQFLLSHEFDREQKKRDFDFYEKLTTHDSSLSTCIFSIAASEIGYHEKAYDYFMNTARMDLDDYHGNTKDGIHAANMAGAWMCIVNGFAGMRAHNGILSFNPYLPESWEEYNFKITYRDRLIRVKIDKNGPTYELLMGEDIDIVQSGKKVLLKRAIK